MVRISCTSNNNNVSFLFGSVDVRLTLISEVFSPNPVREDPYMNITKSATITLKNYIQFSLKIQKIE